MLAILVFSLRNPPFSVDSYLLLSFYDSTRLVKIDDKEGDLRFTPLQSDAIAGLRMHEPTIAFSNVSQRVKGQDGKARYMNSSLVVQATASCVSLLELDEGLQTHVKLDRWEVKVERFLVGIQMQRSLPRALIRARLRWRSAVGRRFY